MSEKIRPAEKSHDAEESVRRFLLLLSNPDALRDDNAAAELREKLASATDPLDRLALLSTIERAENVDAQAIRAAFHRDAKPFAEANAITASAFSAMGVSREDLRAAGLVGTVSRSAPQSSGSSRRSGRRLSVDDVLAVVPTEPFTLKQLEELSGASTLTVRKAVDGLLGAGTLTQLEPDPGHSGPGRAPRRYVRS